jgi:hypothetical protein
MRRSVCGFGKGADGAKHQVVGVGLQTGGERAIDGEAEHIRFHCGDDVVRAGENSQAVEQVVAVFASACDVEV